MLQSLLLVVVSASALSVVEKTRGVPKSLLHLFQGTSFKCGDGTILDASAINDDMCDCADGSDEPGTSACPNSRFFCTNKGYRGKYLPSMYVSDGVCDCCDGSDEPPGKCPQTCDADGAAWRTAQADSIRTREAGAAKRAEYVAEAVRAKSARAGKITELEAKLSLLKATRENVERVVAEAEAKEKAEGAAIASAAAAAATPPPPPPDNPIDSLGLNDLDNEAAIKVFVDFASSAGSTSALMQHLREKAEQGVLVGYGSDFNPVEGGNAAALGLNNLDKQGAVKVLCEFIIKSSASEALVAFVKEKINKSELPGVASTFSPSLFGVGHVVVPEATPEHKSAEGNSARELLSGAKLDETVATNELNDLRSIETSDFGQDGEWFHYKDKAVCLDLRIAQYNYKACPFGRAEQDGTLLGSFTGWKKNENGSFDHSRMLFENGAHCWNGPSRSLEVHFSCGSADALVSVDEPNKCVYVAEATSPAACDGRSSNELNLELEEEAEL